MAVVCKVVLVTHLSLVFNLFRVAWDEECAQQKRTGRTSLISWQPCTRAIISRFILYKGMQTTHEMRCDVRYCWCPAVNAQIHSALRHHHQVGSIKQFKCRIAAHHPRQGLKSHPLHERMDLERGVGGSVATGHV